MIRIITILLFLVPFVVSSQEQLIKPEYNKQDIKLPRKLTKDPYTLSSNLIKNKTNDKEKFDAIYAWVASNIHYDWGSYYSSNGYGKPDIKSILKYRFAICLGYANLMDTLCKLSGIDNITVYGYAKDELFDVHDSLYFDNHAWNAVKLDNKWYVYDATWSSGKISLEMTKWTKKKHELYLKLRKKRILEKKIITRKFKTECDSVEKVRIDTVLIEKRTRLNKFLLRKLKKTKYRFKKQYIHKLNTDYYLCDPDTFAITHFPDDPAWSLTSTKSFRFFESDSAFYHLSDSTYKRQKRYGRYCGECDAFFSSNELSKNIILRNESFKNNPRNLFVNVLCNYNISNIKFNESKLFEDSLTKISLLDTAIYFNRMVKNNLRALFTTIETESELQKDKNRNKEKILLAENNIHRALINRHKGLIKNYDYTVRNIEKLFLRNYKKENQRKKKIKEFKTKEKSTYNVKNTESKIREIKAKIKLNDSLLYIFNSQLDSVKNAFIITQSEINNNAKFKTLQNDSIYGPLYKSINLRLYGYDNYKKPIVEVRKNLNRNKINYFIDLNELIYSKIDIWENQASKIFELNQVRYTIIVDNYKLYLEMVRRNLAKDSILKIHKDNFLASNKENRCWNKSISNNFFLTHFILANFLRKHQDLYYVLDRENRIEAIRAFYTNKEIQRRKRKYRTIIANNLKVASKQEHYIKKNKREFLKKLRIERREAEKLSKRNK